MPADHPSFEIDDLGFRGARWCRVWGDLDLATSPPLEAALGAEMICGNIVILDLRGVEFVDARGLGMIVGINTLSAANGTALQMIASPAVTRLMRLCGMAAGAPGVSRAVRPRLAHMAAA